MKNGEKVISEINTGDSAYMIQICLNCDLPRCVQNCTKMSKAKGKQSLEKKRKKTGKPGVLYPYKDVFLNLADASRLSGIPVKTLKYRMKRNGMTLEQAIEKGKAEPRKRKEKKHEPSTEARAEKAEATRVPPLDH